MASGAKKHDFVERSFQFALSVRKCVSDTTWTRAQWTDANQLLRSSGSVAANYIEANNAVSKADFCHRIAISKKEASESLLWLRLLAETSPSGTVREVLKNLHREADGLTRILAAILRNSQKRLLFRMPFPS